MRRASAMSIGLLRNAPGQLDQPVEVAAHHAVLGGSLRHALQPPQLLARLLLHLLWHLRLGDGLAELGNFRRLAFITLAELAANGGHLLAQQNFALPLVDGGFGLSADLVRQPQDLDALRQHARDLLHARREIDRLEDLLFLLRLHIHVSGREVRQRCRRCDGLDGGQQIRRRLREQLQGLQRPDAAD